MWRAKADRSANCGMTKASAEAGLPAEVTDGTPTFDGSINWRYPAITPPVGSER